MAQPTFLTSPLTLTFSPSEMSQLEAFATLHGETLAAFVRRVTLAAAHIKSAQAPAETSGASWMDEPGQLTASAFTSAPRAEDALFSTSNRVTAEATNRAEADGEVNDSAPVKRGVIGERSQLAKGKGAVWEIRCALGNERVHGLGWTREQLAFVLKLSVVGVRKMEHQGTSPVKSLEARRNLLQLAQTLEHPTPFIAAFIAAEVEALSL